MMGSHSNDSLDEDRILNELKRLDQRLNSKTSTQTMGKAKQEYHSFGKYPELQECDRIFLSQINNMDYFSEINNKDPDEDSLFEHQMHFLRNQPKQKQQSLDKITPKSTLDCNRIEKKQDNQSKALKNSETNASRQAISQQILREQAYAFKKQMKETSRNFTKKETSPRAASKINKNCPSTSQPNLKRNIKLGQEDKKKVQGQDSIFQKYLYQDQFAQSKEKAKEEVKTNKRLKTQVAKPSYEEIQTYLSQLLTSHTGSKGVETSKSRSRVLQKNPTNEDSLECTFKPRILQKSKEMVKSNKTVVQRLSVNNVQKNEKSPYQPIKQIYTKPKMERIEQLSQPRKIKVAQPHQVEELPSFKPCLSKKSLEHMSNCTYDVATRNKLWLEQKQEKIQRMRKEEEQEKYKREECTYSPAIRMYKGEQDVQFSRFGKQGMVNYFERLSMMKKRTSTTNVRKEDGYATKDFSQEISNKENTNCNFARQKAPPTPGLINKMKKQTYEDAVKSLHSKIMKLKI